MAKYRKKPVVIEAIVFTDEPAKLIELGKFVDNGVDGWIKVSYADRENPKLSIETLEGTMQASIGDYIIKGVNGEFYPCKPDIFAKTYEAVE